MGWHHACRGAGRGASLSIPRAVESYGEIRARILSRLLCEHEKEVAMAHRGSQAFEAPGGKLLNVVWADPSFSKSLLP